MIIRQRESQIVFYTFNVVVNINKQPVASLPLKFKLINYTVLVLNTLILHFYKMEYS